jgi:hypothetical protein
MLKYIVGLIVFTWVLLIIIGLGFITTKMFNTETITTTCPNVDVDIDKIHIVDGVQYIKLNYPNIITKEVYDNVLDLSNKSQRGIIQMSLVSIWLILFLIIPLIFVFVKKF